MAPLGTNVTAEHSALVSRYAKDTVVMFDDDRAGIQASVKAANVFMETSGWSPKYFTPELKKEISGREDFNSHNTTRLDVDGMGALLLKLDCIQKALRGEPVEL